VARSEGAQGNTAAAAAALTDLLLGTNANEVIEPGFSITYYPGTTDSSRAAPISVLPGTETRGTDFALVRERTFRIQGRVFDSRSGKPPQTAVVQISSTDDAGSLPKNGSYDAGSGAFEFREVAAGNYVIRTIVQGLTGPTAGIVISQVTANVSSNIENMILNVRPGLSIPGQVTL